MIALVNLALAPVLICLVYIFIRDKYEKEPYMLLLTGIALGVISIAPIIFLENYVTSLMPANLTDRQEAFYDAFLVAALVEESVKYAILLMLVWRSKNFNEKFDGIVYAVFISLGFAGIENLMYVLNPILGGMDTALIRGVLSVPMHGVFGVTMGYFLAIAKFRRQSRPANLLLAFAMPYLMHALYDYILMSGEQIYFVPFALLLIVIYYYNFMFMKRHILASPFKK